MLLHFVRHASAADHIDLTQDSDDLKYLSLEGRIVARRFFSEIRGTFSEAELMLTSPLIRAVQTSEILASVIDYSGDIVPADALRNETSTVSAFSLIDRFRELKNIVLVGHEPKLSILLNSMCGNTGTHTGFAKCGTAAVEYDPDCQRGELLSYSAPGKLSV